MKNRKSPVRNSGTSKPNRLSLLYVGIFAVVSAVGFAVISLALGISPLRRHSPSPHLPNAAANLTSLVPTDLKRPIDILLLGIDNSGHPHSGHFTPSEALAGNSDTMLLVRLLPDNHQINILSIPRDTRVQIPGFGFDKINAANSRGGVVLAAQTVSQALSGVAIDRYVRVDTEGLIHLVDALGGVEIDVAKPMDYVDQTQNLNIHLAAGKQLLNGEKFQEYIRFRHDALGDIGRVQRQQQAMKAILNTLLQPTALTKIPQILQVAQSNIDTDLSVGEMLAIAQLLMHTDRHNVRTVMLPGRFSRQHEYRASYWIANSPEFATILNRYFNVSPTAQTDDGTANLNKIKITITNATNRPEVGTKAVTFLRKRGFIRTNLTQQQLGAIARSEAQTQIIAQQGDVTAANAIEQAIGMGQVQVESTGDIDSDITIVVGTDWADKLATCSSTASAPADICNNNSYLR